MNTIWLTLAINILRILRWYYSKMPPEDRAELNRRFERWKQQIRDMEMPAPPPLDGR
jgi:hypothetical protein